MTKLSEAPLIHESATVSNCTIGRYTEIAESCRVSEAEIGDYSYICEGGMVWCATIGKFANIAAYCRINATKHPMWRPTLHHFTYRRGRLLGPMPRTKQSSSTGDARTASPSVTMYGSAMASHFCRESPSAMAPWSAQAPSCRRMSSPI